MYVLDASAFIDEYDAEGDIATIPAVREELGESALYRFDAMEGAGMYIHIPSDGSIARVRTVARSTGDLDVLSETDIRLLGAAIDVDGVLVSDDYAVQNVAEELNLAVESIATEGIEERRDWHFQCEGCGREFDTARERCPVCGSSLARKNPN